MKFLYGIKDFKIDVTPKVYEKCKIGEMIIIPSNDVSRAKIFGDPMYGIVKLLYIEIENEITEYDQYKTLYINLETNEIKIRDIEEELKKIQNKLKINFGGFHEEVPEQKMSVSYLTGNEKVLEIGGNIGRNSLIIGWIVKSKNFVTLECDENIAKQLEYNRNQNGMDFTIEN